MLCYSGRGVVNLKCVLVNDDTKAQLKMSRPSMIRWMLTSNFVIHRCFFFELFAPSIPVVLVRYPS